MKRVYFFVWILVGGNLWNAGCTAQTAHPPENATHDFLPEKTAYATADDSIFYQKLKKIGRTADLVSATMKVASSWVGTPYTTGTLEQRDDEKLVINLRQLDCWTYIESSLAIALTARDSARTMENFASHLQQLRYRDGIIDGYGSRIHYFSDWLLNAASLGYVQDMTAELGGVPLKKKVSFMTDSPRLYPKLKDPVERQKVENAQDRINAHDWYFIPKNKVAGIEHKIKTGDIIILTSSRSNLDVEHQGFAVRGADGHIHLMHASSTPKKVILSTRTLVTYIHRYPAMSGIMIARIQE